MKLLHDKRVFFLVCCLQLTGCYYFKNAYQFSSYMSSREYIPDLIANPDTDLHLRKRLMYVLEIIEFAAIEGLNTDATYEYYIKLDADAVSYLVVASEWDQLKAKTWWFPLVGRVPYLGFFDVADRDRKAKELENLGYDVTSSEAAAFSGLGWFSDPVFSSFLERRDESLANMLFHELVHRTLWVKDQVEFNEQLAEYVSAEMTRRFLNSRKRFDELRRFEIYLEDRILYLHWLLALKKELSALFSRRKKLSTEQLLQRKREVYERFLTVNKPKFSKFDFIAAATWNNARVISVSLYSPEKEIFDRSFRCFSNRRMGEYIGAVEQALSNSDSIDPKKVIGTLCSEVD